MKKHFLTLLIGTMMLCACGGKSSEEQLVNDIQAVRERLHNVGLAVVVVKDNAIIYENYFGEKNVETHEALSGDCMFRIASISKSFTTTSLLQLVEQGKVSLQTDVSELAGFVVRNPRFPERVITLEMLLSHTSSINDSQGYWTTIEVLNPEYNTDYALCYNDYAPGEGYEYCNLNLNLAGTFLERLSGERFDQYVVKHILRPLGLYGGYCVDSLDRSRFASLYEVYPDTIICTDESAYAARSERIAAYQMGQDALLFSPTGGMKLSAHDLARYMLMHMNNGTSPEGVRILPDSLSEAMRQPRSDVENYGLSLWQTDLYSPGVVLTGHTGGAYGMRSAMFFHPEKKYGFVVISNGALEVAEDDPAIQADPSGSAADAGNILTATLRVLYKHFFDKI